MDSIDKFELSLRIFVGCGFFFFGIASLVVQFTFRRDRRFLYLFFSGLFQGVWTLSHLSEEIRTDLGIDHIFNESSLYMSAFLTPIPMLRFCLLTFAESSRKAFTGMILAHSVIVLAAVLAISVPLLSPLVNNSFNIITIASTMVIGVSGIRSALKGNTNARLFLVGLSAVFLSLFIDTVVFFNFGEQTAGHQIAPVTHLGMMALFICQVAIMGREQYRIFNEILDSRKKIQAAYDQVREAEEDRAVAQMMQMLAHDVRKPFSSVKMVLGAMSNMKSMSDVQQMTLLAVPEINRSIDTVNGLIQDVMEIGSKSEPVTEIITVTALLDRVLTDVFRLQPNSDVAIDFNFFHCHMLEIDTAKTLRVFSNIITNGLQAMSLKGHLRFATRETQSESKTFVEFRLSNNGPHIPEEHLSQLFDAFFTSGKKGGTGLGLAIAHKVIIGHGGSIRCESAPGEGVTFVFTLPASEQCDRESTKPPLAPHSADYIRAGLALQSFDGDAPAEIDEITLIDGFEDAMRHLGKSLVVLLVDDERIYRESLLKRLNRSPRLALYLDIHVAGDPYEALVHSPVDLAIIDVDLGCQAMNGFDVVARMRSRGDCGLICTHSNRILASDHKTAIEHGADAFLPKPMSSLHLLKQLRQAADRAREQAELLNKAVANERPDNNATDSRSRPDALKFAFVDDSTIIRTSWKLAWKGEDILLFSTPESFLERVESDPEFLTSISCVITDFDFGTDSSSTGRTLAAGIRKRSDIPIFLASDGDFSLVEFGGDVDSILTKHPPSRDALVAAIAEAQARKKSAKR